MHAAGISRSLGFLPTINFGTGPRGGPPAQTAVSDSAPDGLTQVTEKLSLAVRSRTRLQVADDGTQRLSTSTRLRFRYTVETSDGQRLELQVKAKFKRAVVEDEQGNQSTRTRVKLQFALAQQSVADGLNPLLGSDGDQTDTGLRVAQQLEQFVAGIDRVVEGFADEGSVTADESLVSAVNAFNSLVDNIESLFLGQFNGSPLASEPPLQDLANVTTADAVVPGSVAVVQDASVAVDEPVSSVAAVPGLAVTEVSPPAPEVENTASPTATTSLDPTAEPEVLEPVPTEAPSSTSATASRQLVSKVLVDVRLRFVAALTDVIQTLTPSEASAESQPLIRQTYIDGSLHLRSRTLSLIDVNA